MNTTFGKKSDGVSGRTLLFVVGIVGITIFGIYLLFFAPFGPYQRTKSSSSSFPSSSAPSSSSSSTMPVSRKTQHPVHHSNPSLHNTSRQTVQTYNPFAVPSSGTGSLSSGYSPTFLQSDTYSTDQNGSLVVSPDNSTVGNAVKSIAAPANSPFNIPIQSGTFNFGAAGPSSFSSFSSSSSPYPSSYSSSYPTSYSTSSSSSFNTPMTASTLISNPYFNGQSTNSGDILALFTNPSTSASVNAATSGVSGLSGLSTDSAITGDLGKDSLNILTVAAGSGALGTEGKLIATIAPAVTTMLRP